MGDQLVELADHGVAVAARAVAEAEKADIVARFEEGEAHVVAQKGVFKGALCDHRQIHKELLERRKEKKGYLAITIKIKKKG